MKKKALPLGLLALSLALAACGPTAAEDSGSDSKGTDSSSVTEGGGSGSASGSESTESGSSTLPPEPEKGWTEEEKVLQEKYLGEGEEIPYIDLSAFTYEFVDYDGFFSIEVQDAPYAIVLDYYDILIAEGYVEDTPENAGIGLKAVFDYQDGYHIEYELYCTDENWAYNEISGIVSIDVYRLEYNPTYPADELAAWLQEQGIEGVSIPDFSLLPSENWDSGEAEDYFAILWGGPKDEVTVEDIEALLVEAGWTLDATQGGYVDTEKKVVIVVGTTSDGTVAINILLPLPTEIPLAEINAALASLYDVDPIDIPGYPGNAAYEVDDSLIWIGYFSVNVWTDGDSATWAETLKAEGWTVETDEYGDLACTDPTGTIVMTLTDSENGIMVSFSQAPVAWPTEDIQAAMASLGAEAVVLPDLTELELSGVSIYDNQEENPGMIQIVVSSPTAWNDDVIALYVEAGWKENSALGGYEDPTGTVYAVIGLSENYDIIINIRLMPEIVTEWPAAEFGQEVSANFADVLVEGAKTLSLPEPEVASAEAGYFIANDGYSPTLNVIGITAEEVDAYVEDLLAAGFEDTGFASLFTGVYAFLADEASDIALLLAYDEESQTLTISPDALTYYYKWDAAYVEDLLSYIGASEADILPAIEGYCYIDTSAVSYYSMFGIYVPGDVSASYGEALAEAGWTYDAENEVWLSGQIWAALTYEAEAGVTTIMIIGPGSY